MKLTKIKLESKSGSSIDLTIDEARDLYNQLHELFGTKYIPSSPIYIDPCYTKPYPIGNNISYDLITDNGLNISYMGVDK